MNGIVIAIECRGDYCAFPMGQLLARLRCQRLAATSSCPSLPQSNLITLTHILPLLIHFAPSAVPLGYCDFSCALIVLRIANDDSCLSRLLDPCLVFRSATPTPRLAACCLVAAH